MVASVSPPSFSLPVTRLDASPLPRNGYKQRNQQNTWQKLLATELSFNDMHWRWWFVKDNKSHRKIKYSIFTNIIFLIRYSLLAFTMLKLPLDKQRKLHFLINYKNSTCVYYTLLSRCYGTHWPWVWTPAQPGSRSSRTLCSLFRRTPSSACQWGCLSARVHVHLVIMGTSALRHKKCTCT